MCLAQGHNAVTLVKLEPATPQSRVKHDDRQCKQTKHPTITFFLFDNPNCIFRVLKRIVSMRGISANSVKPDQTPQNAVSDRLEKSFKIEIKVKNTTQQP